MFDANPIPVRLGVRDVARLDAIARRMPGGMKRGTLLRELVLRALPDVEADPARLLRPDVPPLGLDGTPAQVA